MADGSWHNFETIAKLDGTLVFLMGIKNLPIIVSDLIVNGKDPKTPIAIIEKGATAEQRVTTGTLDSIVEIAKEKKIVPPAITIIGEVVNLRDTFKWFENSHCLGARQLQLILKDQNGVSNSILYTSDIGSLNTKNHYVPNTEIPNVFNKVSIMECTYGEPGRINKKTRKFDLEHLKAAVDTVTERGGTVIMPCFSFSRTQEILTNLYNIFHDDINFKYDIVVDSILSCDICDLYTTCLLYTSPSPRDCS